MKGQKHLSKLHNLQHAKWCMPCKRHLPPNMVHTCKHKVLAVEVLRTNILLDQKRVDSLIKDLVAKVDMDDSDVSQQEHEEKVCHSISKATTKVNQALLGTSKRGVKQAAQRLATMARAKDRVPTVCESCLHIMDLPFQITYTYFAGYQTEYVGTQCSFLVMGGEAKHSGKLVAIPEDGVPDPILGDWSVLDGHADGVITYEELISEQRKQETSPPELEDTPSISSAISLDEVDTCPNLVPIEGPEDEVEGKVSDPEPPTVEQEVAEALVSTLDSAIIEKTVVGVSDEQLERALQLLTGGAKQ